jgi:hypothetical protein
VDQHELPPARAVGDRRGGAGKRQRGLPQQLAIARIEGAQLLVIDGGADEQQPALRSAPLTETAAPPAQPAPVTMAAPAPAPLPPVLTAPTAPATMASAPVTRAPVGKTYGPQRLAFADGVSAQFDVTCQTLRGFRPLTLDLYQPRPRGYALPRRC